MPRIPSESVLGGFGKLTWPTIIAFGVALLTFIISFVITASNRKNAPPIVARRMTPGGVSTATFLIVLLLVAVYATTLGMPFNLAGGASTMILSGQLIKTNPWVLIFPGLILVALIFWFFDYFNNWYADVGRSWWVETPGEKILRDVQQWSWIVFAILAVLAIINAFGFMKG